MNEQSIIEKIAGIHGTVPFCSDAELFGKMLYSMDSFSKTEDFFEHTSPEIIGHNMAAAACSDLLASGVKPEFLIQTWNVDDAEPEEFYLQAARGIESVLNHYGASGVVRSDTYGTVLDAGLLNDVKDVAGYVVEGGYPASGLKLDFLLKYFEFHDKILLLYKYFFDNQLFVVEALAYCSARMDKGEVHLLITGILDECCLERIENSVGYREAGGSLTVVLVTLLSNLHSKNYIRLSSKRGLEIFCNTNKSNSLGLTYVDYSHKLVCLTST